MAGDLCGFLPLSYTFIISKGKRNFFKDEVDLTSGAGLAFPQKKPLVPHLAIRSDCRCLSFSVFCLLEGKRETVTPRPGRPSHTRTQPLQSQRGAHLLFLLLLLLLGDLGGLVLPHQLREVSHVLVRLLQEVGQALVLLLVDELAVPFLVLGLQKRAVMARARDTFVHQHPGRANQTQGARGAAVNQQPDPHLGSTELTPGAALYSHLSHNY